MIRIESLRQLPEVDAYAVVINCDTNWHTTLALAACQKYVDMPVLLIDCQTTQSSRSHFSLVAEHLDKQFFWLEWPLRPHGVALDQVISEIPASRVLLVDSDLEIVVDELVEDLISALDSVPSTYGAGFTHAAAWMEPPSHALPSGVAYHMERMWIPLVLLDVGKVRMALEGGHSFLATRDHAELGGGWLARLASYRYRLPLLRRLPLPRAQRSGLPKAAWFEYDTGARIHRALTMRGYGFATLSADRWHGVRHYHGATRSRLGSPWKRFAQRLGLIEREGDDQQAIEVGPEGMQARLMQGYPELARGLGLDPGSLPATGCD